MFKSLATRLTALYTLLFAILALLVFGVIHYNLQHNLLERIDNEFIDDGREFIELYQRGGLAALRQEIRLEERAEDPSEMFISVYSPTFELVASSKTEAWPDLPGTLEQLKKVASPLFKTIDLPGRSSHVRVFYQPLNDGYVIAAGRLLDDNEQLLSSFTRVFTIAFSVMVVIGIAIGFYMSKKALTGIERVRETADQISRGNLSQQISFDAQTVEINDLIRSINRMQSQIRNLIKELQDVSNNIAHDLRSPVTRIRGMAEITLSGEQSLNEYQNMSGAVIEECDSLIRMINTMLEIAETDARIKPLEKESLDITAMVRDLAELYSAVAEDKGIKISLRLPTEPLLIAADRSRLQRAFANLLDNALKFTPEGGRVSLAARREDDSVQVTISDSGIGINEHDLPHVYERFYRADRSRSTPGTGLGLSLVKSIIHAHHGSITITSEGETGTQVALRFHTDTN